MYITKVYIEFALLNRYLFFYVEMSNIFMSICVSKDFGHVLYVKVSPSWIIGIGESENRCKKDTTAKKGFSIGIIIWFWNPDVPLIFAFKNISTFNKHTIRA